MNENIKDFDPLAWANLDSNTANDAPKPAAPAPAPLAATPSTCNTLTTDAEQITRVADLLTRNGSNIAEDYNEWLKLGFALVDGLGEGGRGVYHQLSSTSSKYKRDDCDRQYDKCLHAHGGGITVKTFYNMAREAGIDLSAVAREALKKDFEIAKIAKLPSDTNSKNRDKSSIFDSFKETMPSGNLALLAISPSNDFQSPNETVVDCSRTFSDKLHRQDIPSFLHPILDSQPDAVGRDKMLLGALNLISGILPGSLYSIYDRRRVYAPLYNIIYGRFATSKGDLEAAKQLVMPIKHEMRRKFEFQKEEYEQQHAQWEAQGKKERGPEPKEPVLCSPFVSANSSASAVYRGLDANEGWGVMFETEADTLTAMLSKSEYGDYSDLLRKAHHHEAVAMVRVSDKVNIEIDSPRLSVFLTCTGSQLPLLLPANNVANGLASRFLFYALPDAKVAFRNVFEACDTPVEDIYKELGQKLLPLYHALQRRMDHPIQFVMSRAQQQLFVDTFDAVLREQFSMLGDGIQGFIFRLALECYRYAMILSILRRLSEWSERMELNLNDEQPLFDENEQVLLCDERDFQSAITIINCLVNHTGRVYSVLGTTDNDPFAKLDKQPSTELKAYYQALPSNGEFKLMEAQKVAGLMHLSERTANRYLGDMVTKYQVLGHPRHGVYIKVNVEPSKEE